VNIVVTWPKDRPLSSYLLELARAEAAGEDAFYRVRSRPDVHPEDKCYHVHDGWIRGYLVVQDVVEMGDDAPIDQVTGRKFEPGIYVQRHPRWYAVTQRPMAGFRGYRYYDPNTGETQ
jgi:hypothetical protein